MLNNFELILLDNLIYILKAQDEYYKNKELGKIIEDLLCGEVESSDTTNSNREYSKQAYQNTVAKRKQGYVSNRRLSQVISADYFRRKYLSQFAVNEVKAFYIG